MRGVQPAAEARVIGFESRQRNAHNTAMLTEPGPRPSFAPRHWPGWMLVGLIAVLGKTPQWLALAASHPLGAALRLLMRRRRRIAQRNIERCFPAMAPAAREHLLRESFCSLARAIFEIAWAWTVSDQRMRELGQVEGSEHIVQPHAAGRGVLVVTAHMSCLEIGGRLLASAVPPICGMYRPLRNPVIEWYQNRARLRYGAGMISKRDLRSAIRHLRQGGIIWYAPDQDFGPGQSVFAPFFGVETATLLATHRLAQMTGCAVVPMFPVYAAQRRRYIVRILPSLEEFPTADAVQDLTRLNALMEQAIREVPGQYWWIHRRFKTRPAGEAPFYA